MIRASLTILAILLALSFLGSDDFDDAVAQQDEYCSMVAAGAWPAYNKSINCDDKNNGRRVSEELRHGAGGGVRNKGIQNER